MRKLGWKNRIFFACFISALAACSNPKLKDDDLDTQPNAQSVDVQRRSSIHIQLALEYFQQGQHKLALDEIRRALAITPNLLEAYSLRALVLMDFNEPERAEENFLYALKLAPNNSDIANNYGWFLCQNGREKQSIPYFEKVLKDRNYATPVKALSNAGVCSLRMKDIANAERFFMLGFQEDPSNPSISANLAKLYLDKGSYDKAKFYIQRVIKAEIFTADVLWLGIKIENKLGDREAVADLGTKLRRRHPNSKEYALFQRGAFNE